MKRIILAIAFMLSMCVTSEAMIYRNSTANPTKVDSFSCVFGFYDANMKAARIATDDYLLVTVIGPTGAVVYDAKIDSSSTKIVEEAQEGPGATDPYLYSFSDQVSNIDGAGDEGMYWVHVTAYDTSALTASPFLFPMPVYGTNYFRMIDSITAMYTVEFSNIIADDYGTTVIQTERTDGTYPTDAQRWKIKTGAGFGSGDSVNTNSKLDTDGDADVDGSDTGQRLIIAGDSTVCLWVGASSVTKDTTTARARIDTTSIDPRFFSTITFWAYVDMEHTHEGFAPGDPYTGGANAQYSDGNTALGFIRVMISSDTTLATYYYKDFGDTAVCRGWNKFVIHQDDFSKVGSIVWPVADTSKPLQVIGFMVETDSVNGSSGMRDIRLCIDDIRVNKRSRAKFMFRLDDGHMSQISHAYPVFQDFSFRPTSNVCAAAITSGHGGSSLDTADIRVLYEDGWDIANHAWYATGPTSGDSIAMAGTSQANDRNVVNRNYAYLLGKGLARGAGFFAYPYDAYDSTAIAVVSEYHDFATGGKFGGFSDHADEIPEKASAFRYTYPYLPWTSNQPEVDIDTVKLWIRNAIKRGIPCIVGAHSFKGHHVYVPTSTVSHVSGDSPIGAGGTFTGTNAPEFVFDGTTPNDNNYLVWTNADGGGTGAYVVCSLNTNSTWYVTKNGDNAWIDTVQIQWRIRGSASTSNDALQLVLDTSSTETLVNAHSLSAGSIPTTWTTYTTTVRRASETDVTGNDWNAGVRLNSTLADANDSIFWSWSYVRVADDSGTTSGYGTQMDSSYLRAICDELVLRQGEIDVVTLSEYFRTAGSGGRLSTVLTNSTETLDTVMSMAVQLLAVTDSLNNLRDSLQAALDTLQSQDDWVAKQATLTTVSGYVDGVEGTLATMTTTLSTISGYVDQVEGYTDGVEGTLATISGYVDQLEGYTDQLEGYTDQIEGYVDGIEATQASHTTTLSTISGYVDQVEGYVDGAEGTLATIQTYVDGVEATQASHTTTLSTIAGYVDQVEGYVDGVEGAIAALNNLSQAQAQTAATAALNAYDPPTYAELLARTVDSSKYVHRSDIEDSGLVQIYVKDDGDTVYVKNGVAGGGGADSTAIVNGVRDAIGDTVRVYTIGGGSSSCGEGSNLIRIVVADTAANTRVGGVWLTFESLGESKGEWSTFLSQPDTGVFFTGFNGTQYELRSYKAGYLIGVDTISPALSWNYDNPDSAMGYAISVPAAGLPALKTVYAFVNPRGITPPSDSLKGMRVEAKLLSPLPNDTLPYDTSTGYSIGTTATVTTRTDSLGRFTLALWPNSGLKPYTEWDITVLKGSTPIYHRRMYLSGTATQNIGEY